MGFEEVSDWIEQRADEMVRLQAELTRRPALGPQNGGEGEWEKARYLENYLTERGFSPLAHYDAPDDRVAEGTRPNLALELPGAAERPRIWVMTHLDVVPAGERAPDGTWKGWDSDPFTVRREGDKLYGRGVEDNQQAIVASIFAARALKELRIQPPRTVVLLMVSDEETGSNCGLKYVLNEYPNLFSPDDIIIVPDGGNRDGSMIEIAEKSMLWLRFSVQGRQAHGSMPHLAINAFRAASHLVCRLDEGLKARFEGHESLYDPPSSTFEPTLHEANVPNINTIPGEECFCFDCRVLPEFGLDEVLNYVRDECARLDRQFGTRTTLSVQQRLDAPPPTAADAPVVSMIRSAVARVYGVEGKPRGIGGGTVAAFFREKGLPAAVWSRCNHTAHQANEYCRISNMTGDAKVFADIFLGD